MTNTYWDLVLAKDNALEQKLFEKVRDQALKDNVCREGIVKNTEPSDTKYKFSEDKSFDYLKEWAIASPVIPKLNDHEIHIATRHHVMEVGGKMTWHTDHNYSVAVSIYLTNCDGGEIEVSAPCQTQSVVIKPVENRAVVLKCNQFHRVLPVLDGTRHSIQMFIKYVRLDSQELGKEE